jgi:hypothetical protein
MTRPARLDFASSVSVRHFESVKGFLRERHGLVHL